MYSSSSHSWDRSFTSVIEAAPNIWNLHLGTVCVLYVDLKWDGSWVINDFSTDIDQIVPCERFRDVLACLTAFRLEKWVNFG